MTHTINLERDQHIYAIQREFSKWFPFLRLTFYHSRGKEDNAELLKPVPGTSLLAAAGLVKGGVLNIAETMKVGELEATLKDEFGLTAQVFRHSGNIWLETVMTDAWTLQRQNEHGQELCKKITGEDMPEDFDLNRGSL